MKDERTALAIRVVREAHQQLQQLGTPSLDELQLNAQASVTLLQQAPEEDELLEVVAIFTKTANGNQNHSSLISAYNIGFICRYLKEEKKMNQTEVAGQLNISQSEVSRFSAFVSAVNSVEWGCQFLFVCAYPWTVLKELLTGKPAYLELAFRK